MEIFQDADAFISLQDVEPVHVFIRLDRVSDPLVEMVLYDTVPLPGEFTVFRHQGHEIRGKCVLPPRRLGSDNLVQRDADKPQRLLGFHIPVVNNLIERRKIGIFSF